MRTGKKEGETQVARADEKESLRRTAAVLDRGWGRGLGRGWITRAEGESKDAEQGQIQVSK